MLKNEFIKIPTFGCRRLSYFESLGYNINEEFIIIKSEHLNTGSRQKVDIMCDFCQKEISVTYKEYLRNISIGNKYACCKKCGTEKAKLNSLEKYGVIHPLQLKENQEKQKKTNLEKYGVEFLMQSKEMRERSKETCLEKYGVNHISQTECYKKKCRETNLEKLGVEYPMQSEKVKNKAKQTFLENYGIEYVSQSGEVREKIKNTNLEKYGNEVYTKTDDFKLKNTESLNNKWGCDNIMKSDLFRKGKFSITKDINYLNYLQNSYSIFKCDKGHTFSICSDNYLKRIESNLPLCTICYPIGNSVSIKESQLYEFIRSNYSGEIVQSYRDDLEIDIYLPDLKIGFEFNGLYWHSDEYKEKSYHLDKTNHFRDKGIRIIHIWEDDWDLKQEIIKSQIKNSINLTNYKIYARKCEVREIKNVKDFLNKNHIQGYISSIVKLGLYYNDELVSLMTFDRSEGRKKMEENGWNLSRFCSKIEYNVIGSASKLLSFFIRNYLPDRIISYADNSWSSGDLYYKLGFILKSESRPDYKYVIDNLRHHKRKYSKSNLIKVGYNSDLSESKIMKEFPRIWDCGKIKFEKSFCKVNI